MLGSRESQWRKKKEKANDVLVVGKFTFYERSDKQGPCRQNKYRIWPTKHYKENTHIVILENNSNLVRKVRESISEDVTLELRIKESEGSWESHTLRNCLPSKGTAIQTKGSGSEKTWARRHLAPLQKNGLCCWNIVDRRESRERGGGNRREILPVSWPWVWISLEVQLGSDQALPCKDRPDLIEV